MSSDEPTQFTHEAAALVDRYFEEHPGFTRQGVEQPGQGATNQVIFVHHESRLLVCKVFCETERKEREAFVMRHWRQTGLVPQLVDEVGECMIIMSFVPGANLHVSREMDDKTVWRSSCRETGRALARLTRVPLATTDQAAVEARFYQDLPTLEAYLNRILALGRLINGRDTDFRDDFWRRSLNLIERRLPDILEEPQGLYHQDVGNLHVLQGRFMGFFDLEMCRVGGASMQLGSALGFLEDMPDVWTPMREGWETGTGEALSQARLGTAIAVYHVLCWRVICRYLSYDGTPGTGFAWAEAADPARYRQSIERVHRAVGIGQLGW